MKLTPSAPRTGGVLALKGDEFVEIFSSVIFQIAVLFSFIFIGFTIRQGGFLPKNSAKIFSKLENRILMPAVVINTFRTNCTVKNISEKWVFIAYSTGVLLFCIATGFAVSRFLGKTEYLKKVYRYSISVSNFGFVGTAMVSGIYGAESMELFDYLMFTLPLNLFTYSNFVNPIFVSIFIGAILGLLPIPKFRLVTTIINSTAACMSPIAMILTGFVIGGYSFANLFGKWQTYVVAGIRLVFLPTVSVLVLKLFNAPQEAVVATLCANAMPLGLNTVIIPSAYGKSPDDGASMALVSQLTAVFTIPILFYILL